MLRYQAAQLTYVIDERLKETIEDAKWENALKDVAVTTMKENDKAAKAIKKNAQSAKKAWLVAEKKLTEMEVKLGGHGAQIGGGIKLKLGPSR